jgi:hypothetical protein
MNYVRGHPFTWASGLNSSGTTRVYIGMYVGVHPFAVWLEIFLRLTRLYLAPALP